MKEPAQKSKVKEIDPGLRNTQKKSFFMHRVNRPPNLQHCENSCNVQSKRAKKTDDPFASKERIAPLQEKLDEKQKLNEQFAACGGDQPTELELE